MKLIKNPYVNAAITATISFFYAVIFILTSGHLEFERLLGHEQTLNSVFWNSWSAFLQQGYLKYIGYIYVLIAICVVIISLIRRKNYDEYQTGILAISFIVNGFIMLLLFPIALLLTLSDPNYAVETIVFLVVVHWSAFLIPDLVYTIKWCRE